MFAERLRFLRYANYDTQIDLANKLGVSKYKISQWEREKDYPSFDMLVAICKAYNVSADYLLGITDRKNDEEIKKAIIKDIEQYLMGKK